jgi:DNA-binding transcriptional LysR family regulator
MDIRQFEYVTTIAHELSLSRAAQKLHISAPTLSQFLTRLESELGVPLFLRSHFGVVPTEAGQVYLECAQAILRAYSETLERLSRMKEKLGQVVRVGVTPGQSEAFFTDFLPIFMAANPGVDVRMEESPMPQLDESLRAGNVDFSLAILHSSDAALSGEILYSKELVLAFPENYPALRLLPAPGRNAKLTPQHLAMLAAEKFILSKSGYRLRDAADFYFKTAGIVPQRFIESTQVDQVCRLIQRGAGIGFLPKDLANNHQNLVVFSLEPAMRLDFGIQFLKGRKPSGYGRKFVQELKAYSKANRHEIARDWIV